MIHLKLNFRSVSFGLLCQKISTASTHQNGKEYQNNITEGNQLERRNRFTEPNLTFEDFLIPVESPAIVAMLIY